MGKPSKILIVDDAMDTVELLRKRLRFEGYETIEAYDGEQCLEQVQTGTPDLIILDIMLPKIDGYEVCRRLKANRRTAYIPVLMLTAKGQVEDKIKGLDVGANDYLAKPFDYKELSARIKSLLAIQEAREKLTQEEKSEALDLMMDELAHELRNPLTSIGGFARRVYERLADGDPNKQAMEVIIKEVSRLERMVKDLVDLKTTAVIYKEATDLNDLLSELLEQFQERISAAGIVTEIEPAQDLPPVSIDRGHMKLALASVLENSVEAMQLTAQKMLRITTRFADEGVEIQIADTGRGIPKEKIKNIFDPFFTSKVSGPGLGLTFALKIIQEHRGTISVESKPGEGSCFTIHLPVKRGSAEKAVGS